MTYRGTVSNGVVVLEGEKPAEGTAVQVIPIPSIPSQGRGQESLADLPAFGMWRDRMDLPSDSVDAARELRQQAERRAHD